MNSRETNTTNTKVVQTMQGDWYCQANTGNWASDIYLSYGHNKDSAIEKVIKNVGKNKEDSWLLGELQELLNK